MDSLKMEMKSLSLVIARAMVTKLGSEHAQARFFHHLLEENVGPGDQNKCSFLTLPQTWVEQL